ncbi:hypothetical protein I8748_21125 [Nostoc sp. CENA67]|uniref:Uncharacterized protein n=1 Tax=Amazonocrinis nigriterrae CENA67 TaxID=2794033 RepID=A0A8J7HRK9_9NOST|nr:hypothetical protein [Amazonocrinis nigriterrae]MBH8564656.1 hypothetical protein [Amazonocrinis nigriterrae CENA67]
MNRTILIGLMALPVYLHNTCNIIPFFQHQNPIASGLIIHGTNAHSRITPWQIAARDDQLPDCLRDRTCRE